jgi:hypothetical protein
MELFQNLSLVCLAVAVLWMYARVKKVEEIANKVLENNSKAVAHDADAKEMGRSAASGR